MALPITSPTAIGTGPRLGNQAYRRLSYPSPFFDLSSTYLPRNVRELFRYCEYYFMTNPLINAVISKMSEYPVTEITLDMEQTELKKKWERILDEVLDLRAFLIEAGLDYFTFGNCYVTFSYPFTKRLTCKACNKTFNAENVIDSWVFHNYKFTFKKCPNCKARADAKAEDIYTTNLPKLKLMRWDPKRILVMHNSITGRSYYFFMMPNVYHNDLQLGRKYIVLNTPQKFIYAAKKGRPLKFSDNEIFHLKRPMISGHSSGYGTPLMLPVLKDTFFLQLLKKSQEAIALEHIVPLRVLFPQSPNATGNVLQNVSLRNWRSQVWGELARWKQDQNYMPILGYPLGFQSIGGDGKALMLSQEIGVWSEQIVSGMGVPREFIFGGLSYSGSNVSLRMLENSFLSYRSQLSKLMDWVIRKVGIYMGNWETPKARFRDFKMADDLQRKMFMFQMNQAMKISDETLLSESDLEQEKEDELMNKELNRRLQVLKKQQLANADIQGEVMMANSKYQVKAQEEMAKNQMEAQARMEQDQQEQYTKAQEAEILGQSPLNLQKSNPQLEFPQKTIDLRMVPVQIAQEMSQMDPGDAQQWMQGLEQQFPDVASMVKQEQQMGMGGSGMDPLPEQRPPRRLAESV
jgi:hypothetical protein